MRRIAPLLPTMLALALSGTPAPAATPPGQIHYQGVLRDAAGTPLDGTFDMVFRFTDAPVGGTLLLTDYHTGPDAIDVDGGLFSTLLGGGTLSPGTETTLKTVFARHAPVWLEVQVGAETLSPRVRVVSVGYALNAERLGGQLPDGFVDTGAVDQVKQGALTSLGGLKAEPPAISGDVRAVQGVTHSSAGVGVIGSALAASGATEGVRGQSTSPDGRGVVGGAFATSGATIGVYGESQSPDGTGVWGRATAGSGGTVGVGGESYSTLGSGVAGVAHASSGDAWGVYGETSSPVGYGVVSIGDLITAGDIYATGTKYFLSEHPTEADRAIRFACLEGGEVGVYQRGRSRLSAGAARIDLPEPFPLVAGGRITVQVTPMEESGTLYVPADGIGVDGFTVLESGEGRSDAAFGWLVMAERAGHEDAPVVGPISLSDKILGSARLDGAEKRALRSALAASGAEATDGDGRAAIFAAIQRGDYDGSCRLLGGCGVGVPPTSIEATSSPPRRDAEPRRPDVSRDDRPLVGDSAPRGTAPPPSVLIVPQRVNGTVRPGDVVVLDPYGVGAVRPGFTAADRDVVGVVAELPGGPPPPGGEAPIAVAGVTGCRVDAEYGPIAAGDLLVASPTPGHAMRAENPVAGTVLGKALEPHHSGRGRIRILLTPR